MAPLKKNRLVKTVLCLVAAVCLGIAALSVFRTVTFLRQATATYARVIRRDFRPEKGTGYCYKLLLEDTDSPSVITLHGKLWRYKKSARVRIGYIQDRPGQTRFLGLKQVYGFPLTFFLSGLAIIFWLGKDSLERLYDRLTYRLILRGDKAALSRGSASGDTDPAIVPASFDTETRPAEEGTETVFVITDTTGSRHEYASLTDIPANLRQGLDDLPSSGPSLGS